ncbi:hypothetical protein HBN50_12815 [Halobacteriovorax sp. GB3]|uniref:hypothetical protein n=1 Tax=Halobacteriovorax sp. GB3 TaxID=2719615 RepID=UPI00236126F9|nr:hypothetical protein [Halobacteriovorax sp. GB3]MDD0853986.1 hypothetical protein [Halobacteriovorax sp. GB3]
MLKYHNNKFVQLAESDLKTNGLLERFNLQEAIVQSWEAFTKEIKVPELIYVGNEVVPDERIMGRIDILAFDPNDNVPVVIELKRDRDKYQLLQGISYAAMVSNWSAEQFLQEAKNQNPDNFSDLEEALSGAEIDSNIRIILIAEKFDPEVIISTDWLMQNYSLDITAISLDIFKKDEELYFNFEQKYPLPELNETYELRSKKRSKSSSRVVERSWDDVKASLTYDWGPEFLDKCLKEANGDSNRARFIHLRKNVDGLKAISFFFRKKYLNVYILGKLDEPHELFGNVFSSNYELNEWRNGYSIQLTTKKEYDELCKWLNF